MSLASWPITLPRPHRDGYTLGMGESRRFIGAEDGPPRIGRKFSRSADTVRLAITVDRGRRATFENFYRDTLVNGALPFLMPDAGTDGLVLSDEDGNPITDETGNPLLISEIWLCVFGKDMPSIAPVGVEWRIGFSVLVLP